MKKIFKLLFITLLLCVMTVCVSAQQNSVTVTIDGVPIDCNAYGQSATIVEGRTLVPLRAIFEALGASVEWEQSTKTVTSTHGDVTISLTIGDKKLYRNGEVIELDVAAAIMNGRTMVPVRAISESFGVSVEWDDEKREVMLLTGGYIRGNIDGEQYLSEWMELLFALPEGYSFSDDDYLRELMGVVADIKLSEIDIDKEILVYEFHIADGANNSSFFVEKYNDGKTLEEFIIESATDSFETMGVTYEMSDIHTVEIGKNESVSVDCSVNLYGTVVYLSVSAFERDDYRIGVISCYYDEDTHKTILSCFESLNGESEDESDEVLDETQTSETTSENDETEE